MQPIDALTLKHLGAELDIKLCDGKIHKIQQPSHYEILLHLWVGGDAGRQKLYINVHPQFSFCALLEDTDFLSMPSQPPSFCMLLRKHLTSARITRVETLSDERVLNIHVDNYNELGQAVELVLSIELMGKNSNVILFDKSLNMIMACAHGVSEAMSRFREVSIGYPYVPPPRPDKTPFRFAPRCDVTDVIESTLTLGQNPAVALSHAYTGIGRATWEDVLTAFPDADQAYDAMVALMNGTQLCPSVRDDLSAFSLLEAKRNEPGWNPVGSLSRMISAYFVVQLVRVQLGQRRHRLQQVLTAQTQRLKKRLNELEKTDEVAMQLFKKKGDLLTIAESQQVAFSGHSIELEDYDTGEPMKIDIAPGKSLSDNAQSYYRKYKKGVNRIKQATVQSQSLQHQLDYLAEESSNLSQATNNEEIKALETDLIAAGWLAAPVTDRKKKQAKPDAPKLKTFTSSDGFTVIVGTSGLQNDYLVGKLARGEDVWLHVHLMPGAHVLVKTDKKPLSNQTLLEAAVLAVWYSGARDSVNVPVVYTQARYVRKIPGSYPGHVTYTHEQAVNVRAEREILAKFLAPELLVTLQD